MLQRISPGIPAEENSAKVLGVSVSSKYDTTLNFRHYKWKTRDDYISLKDMTHMHLINTLRIVRLIEDKYESNVCGSTKKDWINAIKSELQYRDTLANKILYKFNLVGKDKITPLKTIFEAAEKGYYLDEKKKIVQVPQ